MIHYDLIHLNRYLTLTIKVTVCVTVFSGLEPAIENGITDAGAHGQEVTDPENEIVFLKIGLLIRTSSICS